jgi:hypothetical protein
VARLLAFTMLFVIGSVAPPATVALEDASPGFHLEPVLTGHRTDALGEIYVTAVGGSVWRIVAD